MLDIKLPGRRRRASDDGDDTAGAAGEEADAAKLEGSDRSADLVDESETFEDAADTHHETESIDGGAERPGQDETAAATDGEETEDDEHEAGKSAPDHTCARPCLKSGSKVQSLCAVRVLPVMLVIEDLGANVCVHLQGHFHAVHARQAKPDQHWSTISCPAPSCRVTHALSNLGKCMWKFVKMRHTCLNPPKMCM